MDKKFNHFLLVEMATKPLILKNIIANWILIQFKHISVSIVKNIVLQAVLDCFSIIFLKEIMNTNKILKQITKLEYERSIPGPASLHPCAKIHFSKLSLTLKLPPMLRIFKTMIIIVHVQCMNPDRNSDRPARSNGHTLRIILVEFYKQHQQLPLIGTNLSSTQTTTLSLSKC